jgi:DNA gyrase subunit A
LQASLVEQIAKLVDEGKITGISDIRDESDRDGMRVIVELKRGKHIVNSLPSITFQTMS